MQDDDYLVLPNIIRTLRYRISRTSAPSIHLLPPHEMLSSLLRTIEVPPRIHTSFAWLGHGAMIRREQAQQFLSLMQHLNASDEETKMVDNYFTILKNEPVELWFDQGIELGGGVPFTVGSEGEARNNRHIVGSFRIREVFPLNTESFLEIDRCRRLDIWTPSWEHMLSTQQYHSPE